MSVGIQSKDLFFDSVLSNLDCDEMKFPSFTNSAAFLFLSKCIELSFLLSGIRSARLLCINADGFVRASF